MGPALKIARRELRAGLKGFRIFLACLALGVTAIAGAGSLSQSVHEGLRADARKLLGGELEIRRIYRDLEADQAALLDTAGRPARYVEMRTMARVPGPDGARTLIEFKAVDDAWPLFGALEVDPPLPRAGLFDKRDGLWGAALDGNLFDRLGIAVGDVIQVGDARFEVRARIVREPDRVQTIFSFGPRVLTHRAALEETGLVQPGSLVEYYAVIDVEAPYTPERLRTALTDGWPDAGWRIRGLDRAAPGFQRFLDNMTLFLSLVGLTALLVGGIGVANGVKAFMDSRARTIAILKCVGGTNALVHRAYLLQVAALSLLGIAIGLVLGAVVPMLGSLALGEALPVEVRSGVYATPLALAAAFGLLTALTFALWPLARVRDIPAAALFRDVLVPARAWPRPGTLAVIGLGAAALAALTVLTAYNQKLAIWFVICSALALALFRLVAWALMRLAAKETEQRADRAGTPGLRLALANLHRPGAPTPSVVLSLGLGLTVLVTVALIEGNMHRQIGSRIPEIAPAYFFIDIQPHQREAFAEAVGSIDGAEVVESAAMVRGRIIELNGEPVDLEKIDPDKRWAVRGDRGFTQSPTPPADSRIVDGRWWPQDYAGGQTLVSLAADVARGLRLEIGQSIKVNILGREITATVANTREVDWSSLRMNFAFIFSPGTLDGAPRQYIATVTAPPEREAAVERAVTDRLPNVSAIQVRQALDAVKGIMDQAGVAVRATSAVTLAAGGLVLAGAIAAGHRRRVYESVVLKVLGATRRDVLRAYLLEYGVLGLATGVLAAILGAAASWAVMEFIMHLSWTFLPEVALATVVGCVAVTLAVGFLGTWRALGAKASPFLRNE